MQSPPTEWRAACPSADERPVLQTLRARICRRCVLGALYFTWVCGVTGSATMMIYSLYALTRSALGLSTIPLPNSVAWFTVFMVLYETYHWLTPPELHRWPAAHAFLREMFEKYPYFRRTLCVFEQGGEATSSSDEDNMATTGAHTSSGSSVSLQPNDKSLFAFHPHGILACGFGMNGVHNRAFLAANTRWLVADNLFWFPFMRDLLHWMDSSSVKREAFEALMERGQNIGFLPGGFEEATLYARGKHRVFLTKRFGFIKLALQHGYKVYPAYTFGEEHTFNALPYFLHLRLKLNALKIPAAIFVGSPWCFFMPRSSVDLVTVVGAPLQLPTIKDPSAQDVQKYHTLYMRALQTLFDKHKAVYATDPHAELEIY